MNSANKKNCKAQNEDVSKAKANLDAAAAALAEVTKQEADKEKQQADAEAGFIMFIVSSEALGLVSRCRIPTAAVAQLGLFRILLGTDGSGVTDVQPKKSAYGVDDSSDAEGTITFTSASAPFMSPGDIPTPATVHYAPHNQ
jgi:hypothetical protein